jgi:hypothetical protein
VSGVHRTSCSVRHPHAGSAARRGHAAPRDTARSRHGVRFIERRGEGVYNIAVEVEDLDAAVAELAERGVRVSEPVEAAPGLRSAFITMSATGGLSARAGLAGRRSRTAPNRHWGPERRRSHPGVGAGIRWRPAPAAEPPEEQPRATPPRVLDLTPDSGTRSGRHRLLGTWAVSEQPSGPSVPPVPTERSAPTGRPMQIAS